MAYVASDVYENGIASEIFSGNVYIALASGERDKDDASFLKKILAISELRNGRGSNNDSSEGKDVAPAELNNVGDFNDKILSLLSISYNRTKSVEGDEKFSYCEINDGDNHNASKIATSFAIIKFSGNEEELTAYQVDNGGGEPSSIKFKGPTLTNNNKDQHKVLIVGNLTSNPTINEDSNFMFGGAKITFTEA